MDRLLTRLLTADRLTILSNSSYFVATTAITGGLGFAYWWLAARRFSPQEVGLAAAAVSAMTLLGNVAMLGFGTLLIAELHRRGDRAAAYLATALLVSCMAGAVLGVGTLLLAPWAPADLASFAKDTGGIVLFPLGVALTAASLVADEALIGLLRGGTRFVRNAVFAVSKLAVLAAAALALGGASGVTIFGAWVAGLLVSMLVIVALGLRHEPRARHYRPDAEVLHHLGRAMFQHHALNMAVLVPGLALPVIVATALSTERPA